MKIKTFPHSLTEARIALLVSDGLSTTKLSANATGPSKRTVQRVIRRCVELGLLTRQRVWTRQGQRTRYGVVDLGHWEKVVVPAARKLIAVKRRGIAEASRNGDRASA